MRFGSSDGATSKNVYLDTSQEMASPSLLRRGLAPHALRGYGSRWVQPTGLGYDLVETVVSRM